MSLASELGDALRAATADTYATYEKLIRKGVLTPAELEVWRKELFQRQAEATLTFLAAHLKVVGVQPGAATIPVSLI